MNDTHNRPPRWTRFVALALFAAGGFMLANSMARSPLKGQPAPDLSLWSFGGESTTEREHVRLSELQGTPVVLDFWAGWCGACRKATPMLNTLHAQYESRGVSFFGVNVEAIDAARLVGSRKSFDMSFPTLHDPDGTAQRKYAITVLPTVVVIGKDGVVRFASAGVPAESALRRAIDAALQQ